MIEVSYIISQLNTLLAMISYRNDLALNVRKGSFAIVCKIQIKSFILKSSSIMTL